MGKAKAGFRDELANPGFQKTTLEKRPALSGEQRTALIRRGNELFNRGSIVQARRVFLTARYTDGLIRIGDYYLKKNNHLEAFRMYWLAPEHRKAEYLIERMAGVVRTWLQESEHE
jgi:hypothetical protein